MKQLLFTNTNVSVFVYPDKPFITSVSKTEPLLSATSILAPSFFLGPLINPHMSLLKNAENLIFPFFPSSSPQGTRHFLLLTSARPEDTGQVRFVAKRATSEARLEVEGKEATSLLDPMLALGRIGLGSTSKGVCAGRTGLSLCREGSTTTILAPNCFETFPGHATRHTLQKTMSRAGQKQNFTSFVPMVGTKCSLSVGSLVS